MNPGDEVVCIGISQPCPCRPLPNHPVYRFPVVGQHYIVEKAAEGYCDGCASSQPCMTPVGRVHHGVPPPFAWLQAWFRPLEYDEDAAVTEAGVSLPVRIEETV